jgi:cytochrome c peroxidase
VLNFVPRRNHPVGRWFRLAAVFLAGPVIAPAADLQLQVEPRWAGSPIMLPSDEVTTAGGQRLRFTRVSALLSGFVLKRRDGAEIRLDGQFGLLDAESGRLAVNLRGVPEGDYSGLAFEVGLPPELNVGEPGRWPAGHPLNPLVNRLHWSWQGGYVFAALEGRWRAAPGSEERGFLYHVATDAHRFPVNFRADFSVRGDRVVRLAWDFARAFAGRELRADEAVEATHSAAGDPLAAEVAAGLRRGWFWLGDEAAKTSSSNRSAARSAPTEAAAGATPLAFSVPAGFPQPALPADNPLTLEGVALGQRLFADPRLAGNSAQSCASCHDPASAFSDRVAFSLGAEGRPGARNAMPLFNLAWAAEFAWDGRQLRPRDQVMAAWRNPDEMNADPETRSAALAADPVLAEMTRAAFGDQARLTAARVALALEQYLLTLISAGSRFDLALRGEAQLTADEQRGFELFATEYDPGRGRKGADCFHCHGGALFTDFGFRSNGLGEGADAGRGGVTGRPADRGRFKTPSLRNVALTGPYMHDGRFRTLEEVVDHYDHGIRRDANLDPNLAKHPDSGLGLSADDRRALVAFLRALTDEYAGDAFRRATSTHR